MGDRVDGTFSSFRTPLRPSGPFAPQIRSQSGFRSAGRDQGLGASSSGGGHGTNPSLTPATHQGLSQSLASRPVNVDGTSGISSGRNEPYSSRVIAGQSVSSENIANAGTFNVDDLQKPLQHLELASSFIKTYLEKDSLYPQLDVLISQNHPSQYKFGHSPSELGPFVPFVKSRFVGVPDEIFDQYNRK